MGSRNMCLSVGAWATGVDAINPTIPYKANLFETLLGFLAIGIRIGGSKLGDPAGATGSNLKPQTSFETHSLTTRLKQ